MAAGDHGERAGGVETAMKIREFVHDRGIPYADVWRALYESGKLQKHTKDAEYDEEMMQDAVLNLLARRANAKEREIYRVRALMKRARKEGTE